MEINIYRRELCDQAQGLCVVIDVLRAFTTAAFAFAAGAKEIIFVSSIEDAFSKFHKDPSLLLMGEVEGYPVEGFHFGNSPSEMLDICLKEKAMVQRTSSGTQGVVSCKQASHILISSFVVAEATIQRILEINPSQVSLIVTGMKNGDEDLALAEYLQSRLLGNSVDIETALERVRRSPCAWRMINGDIAYQKAQQDLDLSVSLNHFSFAMEVFKENGHLVGRAIPNENQKLVLEPRQNPGDQRS